MTHEDLPQVHAMDQEIYETPWSMSSFSHELGNPETIMKVAEISGMIVGYICLRTMLDITHVMKIGVLEKFRRKGIGGRLLMNAIRDLRNSRSDVRSVSLEVRVSNVNAISLYKKAGFRESGLRPSYYRQPDEDALIMTADLADIID
jgi:ribosomal-protein-alanine N-acetyltransferase